MYGGNMRLGRRVQNVLWECEIGKWGAENTVGM